ncbi:MAG: hypothetical protein WKF59_07280 [Chitinophagaceae bacterium]
MAGKRNSCWCTDASSTFTSSTLNNNDVVRVVLTSNAACASPTTATSNVATVTITPAVTPSVSITPASTSGCSGTSFTFTATPTNGGTSPGYQWQVNGTAVAGQTSSTFTSSTLNNNDVVRVVLTSNAACASPTTATSNVATVTITPAVTPSVSITPASASGCSGTSFTFTATPTNGGSSPTYQWQVNGTAVAGQTSSTFTTRH